MPLPNQCIECGKEFIENQYSDVMCKKCAEYHFEPTTADEFNKESLNNEIPKRQK